MESLKGQLLIASPRLLDPNFVRTVVLIVQHDENGALGLILNRPLEATVKQACEEALEIPCEVDAVLHQGGPCEGPLMVVHDCEEDSQMEVGGGAYFTTEREHIVRLLSEVRGRARFFVGYAGWGKGQLEAEMELGSWLTAPAEPEHVFEDSRQQWSRLMTWLTLGKSVDQNLIPDDPSVN